MEENKESGPQPDHSEKTNHAHRDDHSDDSFTPKCTASNRFQNENQPAFQDHNIDALLSSAEAAVERRGTGHFGDRDQ